jgi:2-(1,2-epoxy-1,2-dihydrophenyl)acetyl-CoA isomerase
MAASTLLCDVNNGVATLTMNRPEAKNALGGGMREAFAATVPALVADASVRAVVLTGAGGAFCAGGDLRAMAEVRDSMHIDGWRERMREVQPWLRALIELDRPVIAAVDGAAYGAGFSLALAADFVIASPRARFCMSFMRVGLVPDFAAMYTLPRVVGVQRAKELMLSAREVQAEEALRLGLVMEIVPQASLLERAQTLARGFVGASPLALSLVKQTVGSALASDLAASLNHEASQQALCFSTEAHRQAVDRFLAKEPAAFVWPVSAGTTT